MIHARSKKKKLFIHVRGFRSCSALSAALSLISLDVTPFSAI